jgi:hypothetical protein
VNAFHVVATSTSFNCVLHYCYRFFAIMFVTSSIDNTQPFEVSSPSAVFLAIVLAIDFSSFPPPHPRSIKVVRAVVTLHLILYCIPLTPVVSYLVPALRREASHRCKPSHSIAIKLVKYPLLNTIFH